MPPCQAACPAFTDVQGYVALTALGRFAEAYDVARLTNPFSNSCGYVCFHPCEQNCRRAQVDQPISIMELKRAAATFGEACVPAPELTANGQFHMQRRNLGGEAKRIAIIGAGPAGLTAAQDLVTAGHKVTVYEREPNAGGMLRLTIPNYRLPNKALDCDIAEIAAAGVKIKYGQELGKDLDIDELRAGNDAVIIATGLPFSRSLSVFPAEGDNVYTAIPFLKAVKAGQPPALKDRVIVVGGGNVAIDVARTAVRLGAKEVNLVCLESREEMPAHDWEIEEAVAEGVNLNCCLGPSQLIASGASVEGLTCQAVERVFNEEGRFDPKFVENKFADVVGETVIVSIGQGRDTGALVGTNAPDVVADQPPDVFFAGEFATGPGSAIGAVQNGHVTAAAVAAFLTGEPQNKCEPAILEELPERMRPLVTRRKRHAGMTRPSADRVRDFELFEPGLTKTDAAREGLRCLACLSGAVVDPEKCIACLTCVRVCPFEIPKIGADNIAVIDTAECQACGLCATECPAGAITLRRGQEERLLDDTVAAAAAANRVDFYCMNRLYSADDKVPDDPAIVPAMCIGQVSELLMLEALRAGATAVTVSLCPEEGCFFGSARERTLARVAAVQSTLTELGLDPAMIAIKE